MHFFSKKKFEYENQFAVEKTQISFWVNFKKNASHTFSIYGNCMISILFDKKFFFFI